MQRFKILVCSAATVLVIPIAETQAADHPQLEVRLLVRSLRADSARLYREIRATAFRRPDYKGLIQDADDLTVLAENLERMIYRRASLRLIRRDVVEFERTFQTLLRTAKANVIAKKAPVNDLLDNDWDRSQNGYVWSEGRYRSLVFPGRRLLALFDDVDELLFDLKDLLGIKPIPIKQPKAPKVQPLPKQPHPKEKNNGPIVIENNVPQLPAPPAAKKKKLQPPVPTN